MNAPNPTRIGIVGVNTWHAEAFTDVMLGIGPAAHLSPMPDIEITSIWGDPAQTRSNFCAKTGARGLTGEVSVLVDGANAVDLALVIDDENGGARHRELSEPLLRAGLPVFIDKPMTLTIKDARLLLKLADEHGAPLMSGSALRFAAEWETRAADVRAIGDLRSVTVCGPGDWYYYGIHVVELMLLAMGDGVEWVNLTPSDDQDVAVIGFADHRLATVQVLRGAAYTFTITLYGSEGWLSFDITRNYEFYRRQLSAAVQMARTGVSPVSAEHMLTVLRVLHAGLESGRQGRKVSIGELVE